MLTVLTLLCALTAHAAKIPVVVNVGIGPTVGTIGAPGGFMAPSVGIALQAEGWVSKKVLRSKKVRKRVPQQYRGMVRQMDDLHARPLPTWVIPDAAFIGPLQEDAAALRGATWAPISVLLGHSAKNSKPHWGLGVSPRVAWLNLVPDDGADPINQGWYGASIDPEIQTNMKQTLGVAVGGSVGAGWTSEVTDPALGLEGRPWLMMSGHLRLQVRFPMEINL